MQRTNPNRFRDADGQLGNARGDLPPLITYLQRSVSPYDLNASARTRDALLKRIQADKYLSSSVRASMNTVTGRPLCLSISTCKSPTATACDHQTSIPLLQDSANRTAGFLEACTSSGSSGAREPTSLRGNLNDFEKHKLAEGNAGRRKKYQQLVGPAKSPRTISLLMMHRSNLRIEFLNDK